MAVCASGIPGQVVPGGSGAPEARRARAEYRARVLEQVRGRMERWREAWNGDDADAIVRFYSDDAVYRPPRSGALRGSELVGRFMAQALPLAGEIQTGLTDLEGSGRYVYLAGPWQHEQDGQTWSGDFVMVLEMGRTWQIRSQLFSTAPDAQAPGLPSFGGGGSDFTAVDLSRESPEIRALLDRLSGAWFAGDRLRMAELWMEEVVFQGRSGERATGREEALELWQKERRAEERVQDVVIDFLQSDRFAYAFTQRVVTWLEDGRTRTLTVPAVQIFYREVDAWRLRALLLLD